MIRWMLGAIGWLTGAMIIAGCSPAVDAISPPTLGVATPQLAQSGSQSGPQSERQSEQQPKVVVPAPKYEFGSQPTDTILEHTFEIRNAGNAPLQLTKGSTTCSCTVSTVDGKPIPPGSSGWVKLQWNVGKKVGPFTQAATIRTNDPAKEAFQLVVSGMARSEVEVYPDRLLWDELQKDQDAEDELVIVSQAWREFRVENIRCDVAGLNWKLEPARAESVAQHQGLSGQRLRIHIPAQLTQQVFHGWLEFDVVSGDGKQEKIPHRIEVFGKSPQGLFLTGKCLDGNAAAFGTVRQGTAKKCNLVLRAKGFDESFAIERVEANPSFLRCEVTPMLANGKNVGLFRVAVEIPADAPECIYQTPHVASIRLITNHPEKPELKFYVEFSVLP